MDRRLIGINIKISNCNFADHPRTRSPPLTRRALHYITYKTKSGGRRAAHRSSFWRHWLGSHLPFQHTHNDSLNYITDDPLSVYILLAAKYALAHNTALLCTRGISLISLNPVVCRVYQRISGWIKVRYSYLREFCTCCPENEAWGHYGCSCQTNAHKMAPLGGWN